MNKKEQFDVTMFHINAVFPFEDNPRMISPDAVAKVAKSIKQYGFRQPIVVDDNNYILAGHTRLLASKSLGLEHIPVHKAYGLTEAQKRAYRLADNRSAEESQWDFPKLTEEFKFLESENFDLGLTTFDPSEIDDFLKYGEEPEEIESEEPETPKDPKTVLGDVYKLGKHRLICGDSTQAGTWQDLLGDIQYDLLLTDFPYDLGMQGKTGDKSYENIHSRDRKDEMKDWDEGFDPSHEVLPLAITYAKPEANYCMFTGWFLFWKSVMPFFHDLREDFKARAFTWIKKFALTNVRGTSFANATEIAVIAFRTEHFWNAKKSKENYDYIECATNEGGRDGRHPTSKPLMLMQHLAEIMCPENGTVVDPFLGSGSTLIVAESLGLTCYGMELEPKYCDVIVERWETLTGEKAILETKE